MRRGGASPETGSFSDGTAKKTGISRSNISAAVRRAVRISSDVKDKIKDAVIADSGVQLDALASATPTELKAMLVPCPSKSFCQGQGTGSSICVSFIHMGRP